MVFDFMKNKKLILTAVAAAVVLSMQASSVFAAEVSDSDFAVQTSEVATDIYEGEPDAVNTDDTAAAEEDDTAAAELPRMPNKFVLPLSR